MTTSPNIFQCFWATLIFGRVVQKRGDCLIFIGTIFDDQGSYGHQM
jgi:hypothetical protein